MTQFTINERIKFLIEKSGMSVRAFSTAMGVTDTNTRNYIDRGSKPNSEFLEKLLRRFHNTNPTWLMLGEGEPFLSDSQSGVAQIGKINQASTGNKQTVTSNKGGFQTNTGSVQETHLNAALESANKEIALLREQLAMKDQLIAAKDEMLSMLRSQSNRSN